MEATLNTTEIERYPAYKDSGLGWLGELPKHWEVIRIKYLFNEKNERSNTGNEELLSLSKYHGVIPRSTLTDKVESANSLVGYKLCSKGDLILNKLQAWNGMLDISRFDGIVSPDYSVYSVVNEAKVNKHFFKYLFTTSNYISEFTKVSSGIGDGFFRLYSGAFFNIWAILPPFPEQTAIANFLDRKTAQVDTAIRIKERQIELLKERRQILIHKAVTRGLHWDSSDERMTGLDNPKIQSSQKSQFRHSGVEWIGEIPAQWEVKRLKYLLIERNERSETGEEPLFMVSQTHGLVVRADYHDKAEVAQSNVGNKRVHRNDLVFNKLKAHLGVFFKSEIDYIGIVSPDYAVYSPIGEMQNLKYLELLFRQPAYIEQFIRMATGIVEGLIRLYTGDLFSLKVPVAPAEEQIRILAYIEIIDGKVTTATKLKEKEIEKLKEYKATLINSAVTGKMKVS